MVPSIPRQSTVHAPQQTLQRCFHRAAQPMSMRASFASDRTNAALAQTALPPPPPLLMRQAQMLGCRRCWPRPYSTARRLHQAVLCQAPPVPEGDDFPPEAPLPKSLECHRATASACPSGEDGSLHGQDI
ncbi:hypothetical protein H4R20_006517, partial [Coemansia guatemalensis]